MNGSEMEIAIMGAGGFAKEAAELVEALGHSVVGFWEEPGFGAGELLMGSRVFPRLRDLKADAAIVATGEPLLRQKFFEIASRSFRMVSLVHPSACVSRHAVLGTGTLVMQNVVVNADAIVGDDCLLNVACCVAHDCRVGSHVHLAPAVQLGGWSSVGDSVFCGTAAVVLPRVAVGNSAVCGAGSVVLRNVVEGDTVVGIPARSRPERVG